MIVRHLSAYTRIFPLLHGHFNSARSVDCARLNKLFNQTEPEEEKIHTEKQSIQLNMSVESTIDFVNQSLQLFNTSPLRVIICAR